MRLDVNVMWLELPSLIVPWQLLDQHPQLRQPQHQNHGRLRHKERKTVLDHACMYVYTPMWAREHAYVQWMVRQVAYRLDRRLTQDFYVLATVRHLQVHVSTFKGMRRRTNTIYSHPMWNHGHQCAFVASTGHYVSVPNTLSTPWYPHDAPCTRLKSNI